MISQTLWTFTNVCRYVDLIYFLFLFARSLPWLGRVEDPEHHSWSGRWERFPVSSPSTFNSISQHAERRLPTGTGQRTFGYVVIHGFHKIYGAQCSTNFAPGRPGMPPMSQRPPSYESNRPDSQELVVFLSTGSSLSSWDLGPRSRPKC